MPRSKPSMTTYMNTANARIAAQTLVSTTLSAVRSIMGSSPVLSNRSCKAGPRRDAGGMCRHVRRIRADGVAAPLDMSLNRYQLPMPNTAKYTMTKAMERGGHGGRGQRRRGLRGTHEAVHRERLAPYFSGHPAGDHGDETRMAASPGAKRCSQRPVVEFSTPRASRLHTPSNSMSIPNPTMTRNDQNTTFNGRTVLGSDGVEPGQRCVGIVLEDQRRELRHFDDMLHALLFVIRNSEQDQRRAIGVGVGNALPWP